MAQTTARSRQQNFLLILMLGVLNAITPFSIDMYLPAFPEIAHDLKTTLAKVSFSVSSYFLGYAIGQIFYGPLLDRFGRKRPLYAGLSLYILACVGCMSARSIEMLLIFRFIQAFGGCVSSVAATAMVRDFFPAKQAAKVFSFLILILGASPLLAPTIGGFIVTAWGWQFVFGLLAAIVLLNLFIVFSFLPEGHVPDESVSLKPKPIIDNFKSIFQQPQFYIYTFSGSLSFAGLFVYVAGSPAIFMDSFHVSAKIYGGIFALLSVGFIGGSQLNHLLTKKYNSAKIFKTALLIQVLSNTVFFIGAYNGWYGLAATMVFLFLTLSGVGISIPNATALALTPFTKNAGSASALLGFLQIGIGGLVSASVGILDYKGSLPTASVMFIASATGLIILMAGEKKIKSAGNEATSVINISGNLH